MKSSGSNSTSEFSPPAVFGFWSVAIGGVLGLLSPLGPVPLAIGVSLLVLGTVLSAPEAGRTGAIIGAWWTVLALASLVALIGGGLELVWAGTGRLLVVPASLVAVVTAGLTMPLSVRHRSVGQD